MDKIKVGIIGAGGYGGCGAVELLINHPNAVISALIDQQDTDLLISDLYPHLKGFCDLAITDPNDPELVEDFDIVFFATPDGVGQKEAKKWLDKGVKVLDYSGDFRFNDPEVYKGYASRIGRTGGHTNPDLLEHSVYGVAELHRDKIAESNLVGNPGCFAVSCILGLSPALKSGLIDPDTIICDGKTGVSGAGKNPSATFHYPARYEAMNPYKVTGHQHVYEVERELGLIAGHNVMITFTPHVVPSSRGIMTTIYSRLKPGNDITKVKDVYDSFYKKDTFVRVFGPETVLNSTSVRGSNFCNLSLNIDERTNNLIIVSMIDNLVKGQAGSAVQNMNIMFGLEETAGLNKPGQYP